METITSSIDKWGKRRRLFIRSEREEKNEEKMRRDERENKPERTVDTGVKCKVKYEATIYIKCEKYSPVILQYGAAIVVTLREAQRQVFARGYFCKFHHCPRMFQGLITVEVHPTALIK